MSVWTEEFLQWVESASDPKLLDRIVVEELGELSRKAPAQCSLQWEGGGRAIPEA